MNTNYLKDFMPYEQALELQKLGFDEPCLGVYYESKTFYIYTKSKGVKNSDKTSQSWVFTAPTFSQAFRWFREKYKFNHSIIFHKNPFGTDDYQYLILLDDGEFLENGFNTYEEAEIECLKKLIQIVITQP
jgi:hypothetical protein